MTAPIAIYSSFLRNHARKPSSVSLIQHGIDRWTVELANALADAGAAVDLLIKNDAPVPAAQAILHDGVRQVATGCSRLRSYAALWGYVRRHRPRALVGGLRHANRQLLQIGSMLPRTPVVLSVHDHLTSVLARSAPDARAAYRRELARYRDADALACVSAGVRDDLLALLPGLPPQRVHVLHNPVRVPDCARPLMTADGRRVILGAGRLSDDKGFDRLIDAFALLAEDPGLQLMLCGEGTQAQRQALQQRARGLGLGERVVFAGHVDDLACRYREAAVFVLSSRSEALPYVLLEAMACGTPVVAFDCPTGPAEILDGGRCGALVADGDVDALARAIRDTLDAPGDAALRRARAAEFAPAQVARRWLTLIDAFGERRAAA
ncbi:MAG: glycosyltransferase [Pseudomonadota bacterium]|nr:glycosyltransferase [Pseudomonadota bacterium]